MSEFKYVPVEPTPEDDSIALDRLADYIADTWDMDKKYGLEEICQRLHAMWPGEFIAIEDLRKNDPNIREAVRALLTHWHRFLKSDGNQQDAYNLLVKGARTAWQFAEDELDRSVQPDQLSGISGELPSDSQAEVSDSEMLDWMERHRAEIEECREGWKVIWIAENGDVLSIEGEHCHQRDAIKAAMQPQKDPS